MVQAPEFPPILDASIFESGTDFTFQVPDPENEQLPEFEFQQQVETAWQVCDRFDLQTDIWRGRILRAVRDREKRGGEGHGGGFLNWLKNREISKSQAYSWIELAESADLLLEGGYLDSDSVNCFSKRAFIETAHAAPEVQQMVSDRIKEGDRAGDVRPRITRREVRQLSDEWTAMSSDLLPAELKEQAASNVIPARYLAPLVKEMEKLPESHHIPLREAITENPDIDTLKQVTAEARYLAKYLEAATQVQALNNESLNLELALEEALRLGCLSTTADLVNQAAQLEQTTAKLYTAWKRVNHLVDRLYVDSGSSTPHLRTLLSCLNCLSGDTVEVQFGNLEASRTIRLQIQDDALPPDGTA
ncbi:MAG: hypothetical protein VKJ46_06780 [Leptolyngbyaceae bacterium]|nr:hypothetical protein [Leptolyngbyaceae bacterium]